MQRISVQSNNPVSLFVIGYTANTLTFGKMQELLSHSVVASVTLTLPGNFYGLGKSCRR